METNETTIRALLLDAYRALYAVEGIHTEADLARVYPGDPSRRGHAYKTAAEIWDSLHDTLTGGEDQATDYGCRALAERRSQLERLIVEYEEQAVAFAARPGFGGAAEHDACVARGFAHEIRALDTFLALSDEHGVTGSLDAICAAYFPPSDVPAAPRRVEPSPFVLSGDGAATDVAEVTRLLADARRALHRLNLLDHWQPAWQMPEHERGEVASQAERFAGEVWDKWHGYLTDGHVFPTERGYVTLRRNEDRTVRMGDWETPSFAEYNRVRAEVFGRFVELFDVHGVFGTWADLSGSFLDHGPPSALAPAALTPVLSSSVRPTIPTTPAPTGVERAATAESGRAPTERFSIVGAAAPAYAEAFRAAVRRDPSLVRMPFTALVQAADLAGEDPVRTVRRAIEKATGWNPPPRDVVAFARALFVAIGEDVPT